MDRASGYIPICLVIGFTAITLGCVFATYSLALNRTDVPSGIQSLAVIAVGGLTTITGYLFGQRSRDAKP